MFISNCFSICTRDAILGVFLSGLYVHISQIIIYLGEVLVRDKKGIRSFHYSLDVNLELNWHTSSWLKASRIWCNKIVCQHGMPWAPWWSQKVNFKWELERKKACEPAEKMSRLCIHEKGSASCLKLGQFALRLITPPPWTLFLIYKVKIAIISASFTSWACGENQTRGWR